MKRFRVPLTVLVPLITTALSLVVVVLTMGLLRATLLDADKFNNDVRAELTATSERAIISERLERAIAPLQVIASVAQAGQLSIPNADTFTIGDRRSLRWLRYWSTIPDIAFAQLTFIPQLKGIGLSMWNPSTPIAFASFPNSSDPVRSVYESYLFDTRGEGTVGPMIDRSNTIVDFRPYTAAIEGATETAFPVHWSAPLASDDVLNPDTQIIIMRKLRPPLASTLAAGIATSQIPSGVVASVGISISKLLKRDSNRIRLYLFDIKGRLIVRSEGNALVRRQVGKHHLDDCPLTARSQFCFEYVDQLTIPELITAREACPALVSPPKLLTSGIFDPAVINTTSASRCGAYVVSRVPVPFFQADGDPLYYLVAVQNYDQLIEAGAPKVGDYVSVEGFALIACLTTFSALFVSLMFTYVSLRSLRELTSKIRDPAKIVASSAASMGSSNSFGSSASLGNPLIAGVGGKGRISPRSRSSDSTRRGGVDLLGRDEHNDASEGRRHESGSSSSDDVYSDADDITSSSGTAEAAIAAAVGGTALAESLRLAAEESHKWKWRTSKRKHRLSSWAEIRQLQRMFYCTREKLQSITGYIPQYLLVRLTANNGGGGTTGASPPSGRGAVDRRDSSRLARRMSEVAAQGGGVDAVSNSSARWDSREGQQGQQSSVNTAVTVATTTSTSSGDTSSSSKGATVAAAAGAMASPTLHQTLARSTRRAASGVGGAMSPNGTFHFNDEAEAMPIAPLDLVLDENGVFSPCRMTALQILVAADVPFEIAQPFFSMALLIIQSAKGVVDTVTTRGLSASFNCHQPQPLHQEAACVAALEIKAQAPLSISGRFAIMIDSNNGTSVTVGTGTVRNRIVICKAVDTAKKLAPLLLQHRCVVGVTERVARVCSFFAVPIDNVQLLVDFVSCQIPSATNSQGDVIAEIYDKPKCDEFDPSVVNYITAFHETVTGNHGEALRHWRFALAATTDPIVRARIDRFMRISAIAMRNGRRDPYCVVESTGFSTFPNEDGRGTTFGLELVTAAASLMAPVASVESSSNARRRSGSRGAESGVPSLSGSDLALPHPVRAIDASGGGGGVVNNCGIGALGGASLSDLGGSSGGNIISGIVFHPQLNTNNTNNRRYSQPQSQGELPVFDRMLRSGASATGSMTGNHNDPALVFIGDHDSISQQFDASQVSDGVVGVA